MDVEDLFSDSYDGSESYHCYRCGRECSKKSVGRDDSNLEVRLECPDCGGFSIVSPDAEKWTVKGTDIPYIVGSMTNTAMRYHDFDAASYPDERSAIMAEMDLIDKLCDEYMLAEDRDSLFGFDKRRKELFERSLALGMDELRGKYALFAYSCMLDLVPDSAEYRDNKTIFDENYPYMDLAGLTKFVSQLSIEKRIGGRPVDRYEETVERIHSLAQDWDGVFDEKMINEFVLAANVLAFAGEYTEPKSIFLKCLDSIKRSDFEDKAELAAVIWADACELMESDEELDVMMGDMRSIRDNCPIEFSECAFVYGRELNISPSRHGIIKDDMDYVIDAVIPFVGEFDDASDLEMNAHYIRFLVTGSKADLKKATDIALSALFDEGDMIGKDSAWVLVDYLENRNGHDRLSDIIKRKVRKAGMELDDLYYYAGF